MSDILKNRVYYAARDGMSIALFTLISEANENDVDRLLNEVRTTMPGISLFKGYSLLLSAD